MVVLEEPELEQLSLPRPHKLPNTYNTSFVIPVINLEENGCEAKIVRACEELGFFKVTNHGVSKELMAQLEAEAMKFFDKTQLEKESAGLANPYGYGTKRIGRNGDIGWVEYLLLEINSKPLSHTSLAFLTEPSASSFLSLLNEYVRAMKKLVREVLEMMAKGLKIEPKNVFSKCVMDEKSDSMMRINHYPPCQFLQGSSSTSLTGFGEHTDPQIISVLRSNNTSGLEISLRNGSWVSVPSDQDSFFINVGDSLQVLTNGRFRSVRHRVIANSTKARLSMIYFGGPSGSERLAPLPLLMGEGEQRLYREFTWQEYKRCAYKTRLADNRLVQFEI